MKKRATQQPNLQEIMQAVSMLVKQVNQLSSESAKAAKAAPKAAELTKAELTKAAKAAPKAAELTKAELTKAAKSLQIIVYSEKAYAIVGESKPFKSQISEAGGRFNGYLNVNGKKAPGWLFSRKSHDKTELQKLIKSF